MIKECYMCSKPKTSMEHVPPKCIFPEKKDLPKGWDLRKQLIKVPSCDEHNLEKSKDDEYLLYSIIINILANNVAMNHFSTKIIRSIKRNPNLLNRFLSRQTPVIIETGSGFKLSTSAIEIEYERIRKAFDFIGRALYYNYFGEKWLGELDVETEYLLFGISVKSKESNSLLSKFSLVSDILFKDTPFLGDNLSVFKYKVKTEKSGNRYMRLYFYDNSKITLIFACKQ